MKLIKTQKIDDILTICLSGHIDSANAAETEAAVDAEIAQQGCSELVFDLEDLTYISSAGLRIFLRKRKDYASLKLINVSSEVFEVFEMTGFTEMLPVERAMRKLSVEGCEVIGRGAGARDHRRLLRQHRRDLRDARGIFGNERRRGGGQQQTGDQHLFLLPCTYRASQPPSTGRIAPWM